MDIAAGANALHDLLAEVASFGEVQGAGLSGLLRQLAVANVDAIERRSFYFLLMTALYAYIGLGYTVGHLILSASEFDIGPIILIFMYIILSAIGLIIFLVRTNKKMKQHDSL